MNLREFINLLKMLPDSEKNKEFLFEDEEGRLFGFTSLGTNSDCHAVLGLCELDAEETLKKCSEKEKTNE